MRAQQINTVLKQVYRSENEEVEPLALEDSRSGLEFWSRCTVSTNLLLEQEMNE